MNNLFQRPLGKTHTSRRFTAIEDQRLQELVGQFGARDWRSIAQYMPGRTARQCRDRYSNYLTPEFYNEVWTKEDDLLLYQKYLEYGSQWSKIVQFFPGKNANNIKNRWNYSVSRMNFEELCQNEKDNTSIEKADQEPIEKVQSTNGFNRLDSETIDSQISSKENKENEDKIILSPLDLKKAGNILLNKASIPPISKLGNLDQSDALIVPPSICSQRQSFLNFNKSFNIENLSFSLNSKPRKFEPLPPISTLLNVSNAIPTI
ncbi:Myb-like DNA-binding domain containing protein [Tritrichomonas foetus]|uniref:Myb-like DNA-binding domain containing protein n=1 Tax=Tritrichomonas foetus TaxID=1144522 RepID=A0A1J4JPN2_9EUKA|nr:Myb-like DNA-binding domain containing protein [Tritrichomonas foetus]|eukprot:OHS99485.1 Myb-like DNA-binding domain containing protein [Tritrichomonas foetus]